MSRLAAPKSWMLDKLGGSYAPKPSPGPHKQRECLPLSIFIRNRLKYALTGREVTLVVKQRLIKIDNKVRTDETYPAGFQDVISIEKSGEHFRLLYDIKGRFAIHRISEEEATYKLLKVKKVQLGAKGVPFIVTHDGRTIRYPDPAIKVNDSVKFDLVENKIVDHYKFEQGNLCMLTGGRNQGRVGTIVHRERHLGGYDIVQVRDVLDREFSTRLSNVFVLGNGNKAAVSLPKGKGVKLSIAEERDQRRKSTQSPQSKLLEARAHAQKQLKALLHTLDSSARKQAQAFSAALQALELERKLREVGGKINEATGYEEIERLRLGVGEKEKSLLESRAKTLELKKEYTARVKLRADSQREVNDLLQRKSSWNSADVVRFTELVQQDHENERAEARAKADMEAGEETVEKGFSDLMQAILHRYHEEQVWSDKIRHLSTYGSLAITSLNVLLFIITLLLIEPWRRRRLVENVEERLRVNSREGQEATLAQLVSLQSLLADAQTKLDALTTLTVTPPPPPEPLPTPEPLPDTVPEPIPGSPMPVATSAEEEIEPQPEPQPARTLTSIKSPNEALDYAKERIEGHEVWAAGAAGALGGLALAAIFSALGR
ncbi:hypothetical protein JCM5296_005446 [Sporobolomyces johnsonii]